MNQDADKSYNLYIEECKKIADLQYASAVLQWDEETYMPPKGMESRSRQLATLGELTHELMTKPSFGELLNNLAEQKGLNEKEVKNVLLTKEEVDKQKRFPSAFVRKLSEQTSKAYHSWIGARRQNDFKLFELALDQLIDLKKQEASFIGYQDHPYDALLQDFEKSSSVSMLDKLFSELNPPLKQLLEKTLIKQKTESINSDFLHLYYPKEAQWSWGLYLIKELGFDFEAGRQDISEHPFTTNFSAKDVRITTRIDEHDFANMNWSCIHETGHALYEQGLPDADYGLPSGQFASLSIHESQSRFWENCVGRGRDFWSYYLPKLKDHFPKQLEGVSLDQFMKSINKVAPSLIRTEADELTYHFHVQIRYEIEKDLISEKLKTKDIPARWAELYKSYLGIEVPDDNRGCLQDVHWSHGSFGYFATYSLGSLYAAQFWEKLKQQQPQILIGLTEGKTSDILNWLRIHIHQKGKLFTSEQLCKQITTSPLKIQPFMDYLSAKLS